MTDYIDTRDGWRKEQGTEGVGKRRLLVLDEKANIEEVWVREQPLPTEPYTVIRVPDPDRGDGRLLLLVESGQWVDAAAGEAVDHRRITGFEVLAEPPREDALFGEGLRQYTADRETEVEMQVEERVRRQTAKAVLDRIDEIDAAGDWVALDDEVDGNATIHIVGREFGVES